MLVIIFCRHCWRPIHVGIDWDMFGRSWIDWGPWHLDWSGGTCDHCHSLAVGRR